MKTLKERFWKKVEIIPEHSCWEWVASKNEKGYGKIHTGKVGYPEKAHRVSYKLFNGNIHDNMCVLHKCDNPGCVRPEHLFLGSKKDNSRDMIKKGRGKGHFSKGILDKRSNGGKHNLLKTHCKRGHPYSGDNLRMSGNHRNHRNCKTCDQLKNRGKFSASTKTNI